MKVVILLILLTLTTVTVKAQTCADGNSPIWSATTGWTCGPVTPGPLPAGSSLNMTIANAASTGTTVNRLAKLTGAPSTAVVTATTDTEGAIGICVGGCGTTGSATVAIIGQVSCEFDGATTAGNYVVISTTTAGMCHDGGSAFPTAQAAYGRVLSTNGGAGTYVMELMTPDIAFQNGGNGKSRPGGSNTQVQYNNSGVFAGSSRFLWDDSTWKLTLGSAGGCCQGNILLKEQAGRDMSWGWNGFAYAFVTAQELDIAGGDIYMYTGAGPSQRWRFSTTGMFIPSGSDGGFDIGDSTHHVRSIYFTNLIGNSNERVYSGGAPSISGDGTLNTGSKDSAGKVTSTTTGAASIVVTFSTAFQNAPACYTTNETTANLARAISTTTTVTIVGTTVTGDVLSYGCIGY